jgi:hypothetical protein
MSHPDLHRVITRQSTELSAALHRAAISDWKRLTVEVDLAILRNDQKAWAAAIAAREQLGLDTFATELADYISPLRCKCCHRLVGVSGTCAGMEAASMARRTAKMPIAVRATTHDRLKAFADKQGEQVGTVLDAIITQYLDEKVGKA